MSITLETIYYFLNSSPALQTHTAPDLHIEGLSFKLNEWLSNKMVVLKVNCVHCFLSHLEALGLCTEALAGN